MYETAKDVSKEFQLDLNKLLKKFNAEIIVEEETNIPYKTGENKIKVYIPSKFREDGKCISEFTEIDLGNYINVDTF